MQAGKKPLPFPEPVVSDVNRKKIDQINKAVGREQLLAGELHIISLVVECL
jgi:hypothetical protein